jgi:hypothetical protein
MGSFTVEASRAHSDTPQLVGLLWTSDQSSKRAAAEPRLRPRGGHWDISS